MKKLLIVWLSIAVISSCTWLEKSKPAPLLGMANPASKYCIQQGGKIVVKREAEGAVGYCHFANGKVVDAWQFFYQSHSRSDVNNSTKIAELPATKPSPD